MTAATLVAVFLGFVAGAGAATWFWIRYARTAARFVEREAQQWRAMQ